MSEFMNDFSITASVAVHRFVRITSCLVLFVVASFAAACSSRTQAAAPQNGRGREGGAGGPGVPVVTTTVAQKDVPVDIAAIGNVEAYSSIAVRAQVTGILNEVRFHEGDFVKAGQLL